MKAVVLKEYGDASALSYEEVETPKAGTGEVVVKIAATSVNPIDWKLRSGAMRQWWPLQFPFIPGKDLAGEVVELGESVDAFTVGQRVMALADHTYAEYAVVKAEHLSAMPEGMSFEQAAALPLVTMTGAQLIERGVKAKQRQSILLTGAVGGVGRTAAYVAAQHHSQVIAVVRASQMAEGETLGTLGLVALDDEETLAHFSEIDALADTVGGPVALKLLKRLRKGGTLASVVGAPEGVKDYDIHFEQVVAQPDAARLAQLAGDVAKGRFKIPVAKVMALSEAGEAQSIAEAGGTGGKIILVP
jgi:NADPH:quinone reductase-like Zn-dependent oxidoreductase